MSCYIVTYDLHEGADYGDLVSAIKSYGVWAHITESTWAVVTERTALQVRDHLMSHMKARGRIFVVLSGEESAWNNALCKDDWLLKHL
jgi:hypothetical protein